jgi:hypothetical protein
MSKKEYELSEILRPLPKKLRKNGFDYSLVIRNEKVAVYEQGYSKNLKYYEVFIVRIKPAIKFKGKDIPQREIFPSDGDFGKTAWSCRTMEEAFKNLIELTKQNMRK